MDRYLAWYRQPDLADAARIPPRMPATLLRDFLPFERRTLTRTGVRLFRVDDSSVDLLPLWQRDNRARVARVVVYDPRSLKEVWIADEVSGAYITAPYRMPHPDMTLAESIAARAAFRTAKARDRTEQRLFDNLAEIRAIVAKAKTTTARRKAERALQARRSVQDCAVAASPEDPASQSTAGAAGKRPAWAGTAIAPFADVERL